MTVTFFGNKLFWDTADFVSLPTLLPDGYSGQDRQTGETYFFSVANSAWQLTGTRITIDGSPQTINGNQDPADTQTLSHTIANNNNRLLVVCISVGDSVNSVIGASGVTYNGIPLTKAPGTTGNRSAWNSEIWTLIGPATGTNNIVVTWTTHANTTFIIGSYSLYNVDQITGIGATNVTSGIDTTPTITITPDEVDSWIIDSVSSEQLAGSQTPGIFGWSITPGSGIHGASQYVTIPGGGLNTLSWTMTSGNWVSSGIEILAVE